MGKYMRGKSKKAGENSPMDVPSLGGVLTRARTQALQKSAAAGGSYIQLRSRRLVKPSSPKRQRGRFRDPSPNKSDSGAANSPRAKVNGEGSSGFVEELGDKAGEVSQESEIKGVGVDDEEGSVGENALEIEGRGKSTRETTPCSLIKDPDAIQTPGSSTKPARSTDRKCTVQNSAPRPMGSTIEMEEFFTGPEKQQQKMFIEKYNFDPVNDKPLHGRYEWVKVDNA